MLIVGVRDFMTHNQPTKTAVRSLGAVIPASVLAQHNAQFVLNRGAEPVLLAACSAGANAGSDSKSNDRSSCFLLSGEVPRVTPFETGVPNHLSREGGQWVPDELIMDEQFLVVHVQGTWV